jgi:hypothetical protein
MTNTKRSILLQLDVDPQPSVFDGVVAVDAGIDFLFRHGGIRPEAVRDLVHGCLFTRGLDDLKRTAIFLGGSDVTAAEALLDAVKATFFGPFQVSVLFDPNGSNTTAAAAVLAALDGFGGSVAGVEAAVLAGTGPVGQRVARLLAGLGARVRIGSRQVEKAQSVAEAIAATTGSPLTGFATTSALDSSLDGVQLVVAAGAAGVTLLPTSIRSGLRSLQVAIDLNAVPPAGIEGIKPNDKGVDRDGVKAWGALGVGGTKMKIHRKALQCLFESNDLVLDAEQILEIGRRLNA